MKGETLSPGGQCGAERGSGQSEAGVALPRQLLSFCKKIKNYIIDMISDTSGHINSKIVLGVLSFIVAVIMGFIKTDIQYIIAFLTFSASAVGFSCFDNNSAFKFQKTETNTTTKDIEIKADVNKLIKGKK